MELGQFYLWITQDKYELLDLPIYVVNVGMILDYIYIINYNESKKYQQITCLLPLTVFVILYVLISRFIAARVENCKQFSWSLNEASSMPLC